MKDKAEKKKNTSKSKKIKTAVISILALCVIMIIALFSINAYVKSYTEDMIVTPESASEAENVSCIIVLGCQVWDDGTPSAILEDRLNRAIELYEKGVSNKIIMSGDHGQVEYDEVNAMKQYAIENGIPSEDVFMDHAGFSTYETMYRAKEIFEADKVIIVTQEYHLYRALYIANKLGLEAFGVSSDYETYSGQRMRDFREMLARNKDFFKCILKPEPTFLGDVIPVSGNGDLTNDK